MHSDDPRIKHRGCRRSGKTEKGKVRLSSQERDTSEGGTPVFILLIAYCRDAGIWPQGRSSDFTGVGNFSHLLRVSPHGAQRPGLVPDYTPVSAGSYFQFVMGWILHGHPQEPLLRKIHS